MSGKDLIFNLGDPVDSGDREVKPYTKPWVNEAIVFTESYYQTEGGGLPVLEDFKFLKALGAKMSEVEDVLKSEEFRSACAKRGIHWPKNYDNNRALALRVLSPQQQHCILVVTDPTRNDNLRSRLAAVGISYNVYRNWRKQPAFANALTVLAEDMLNDNIASVHTAVTSKAAAGDIGAARLVYELTGRHDPAKQQMVDLARIVGLILASLQQHVTDPQVMTKLRDDMDKILAGEVPLIEGPKADFSFATNGIEDAVVVDESPEGHKAEHLSFKEQLINGFVSEMAAKPESEAEPKEATRDEGNTPRGFFDV